MGINWEHINQIKRLEERLIKLGYKMTPSKYNYNSEYNIGIYPLEDKHPLYSRDAEIFRGDVDAIFCWIQGIEQYDGYLRMLKAIDNKRIKKLEDSYIKKRVHHAMVQKINEPEKEIDKHTKELIGMSNK